MIILTGGAGFIGSNILHGLNAKGISDVLVVDDLTDGKKFANIATASFYDYLDRQEFIEKIRRGDKWPRRIQAIIHQGACSVTTEWDGRYMMENNYTYSKILLHYAMEHKVPFLYASSAAVYGGEERFVESDTTQQPLNVYGYSKWLFDQYMLKWLPQARSQIVGLRYFNVYGPRENHKGSMASVILHFTRQLRDTGALRLFGGCDGYADGEQRRDFVYVEDPVNVNLWLLEHPEVSGIYNCGTGQSRSFNDMARCLIQCHGSGSIDYIPFPDVLHGCYQSYTQADMTALRAAGYERPFLPIEEGVKRYYDWLRAR